MKALAVARFSRVAAFSLVEVTMALGLAIFCLVSLFGLLQAGLRQERRSIDQARAAHILAAVTDELLGFARQSNTTNFTSLRFPISLPATGAGSAAGSFEVDEGASVRTGGAAYAVHYRIEPPPADSAGCEPYKIRLLVAWPGIAVFREDGANLTLSNAQGNIEATLEMNHE